MRLGTLRVFISWMLAIAKIAIKIKNLKESNIVVTSLVSFLLAYPANVP
jgi:hypothetical protein